ncbi:MAG: CRISPR-associated protein Cas4 [Desulfovibrionaceae bacterium]|nr:CRISPR-associated protein Cas4 [Desulfovibrionaceae bacterium]
MYPEDDLLPLSALQHLLFCPRRAALIYLEQLWADNLATIEGAQLHAKADSGGASEIVGEVRVARGLRLRSLRLGLSGIADVVEFQRPGGSRSPPSGLAVGVELPGAHGLWTSFPIEYKRGRLRREQGYEVQLCAQALCLEEMLGVHVPAGALFYGKTRRRSEVLFTPGLRQQTEDAARRLHELVAAGRTPAAEASKKCESCSLKDLCLPRTCGRGRSARRYLARELESA